MESSHVPLYSIWPAKGTAFAARGRFVFPTLDRFLQALVSWLFIGAASVFVSATTVPLTWRLVHPLLAVLDELLILTFLGFMVLTAALDPGSLGMKREANWVRRWGLEHASELQTVQVDGHPEQLKFCRTCLVLRPPGAHHCAQLDSCVVGFDHYCGVIGKTIARKNHRAFVAFVWSVWLACIAVAVSALLAGVLRLREAGDLDLPWDVFVDSDLKRGLVGGAGGVLVLVFVSFLCCRGAGAAGIRYALLCVFAAVGGAAFAQSARSGSEGVLQLILGVVVGVIALILTGFTAYNCDLVLARETTKQRLDRTALRARYVLELRNTLDRERLEAEREQAEGGETSGNHISGSRGGGGGNGGGGDGAGAGTESVGDGVSASAILGAVGAERVALALTSDSSTPHPRRRGGAEGLGLGESTSSPAMATASPMGGTTTTLAVSEMEPPPAPPLPSSSELSAMIRALDAPRGRRRDLRNLWTFVGDGFADSIDFAAEVDVVRLKRTIRRHVRHLRRTTHRTSAESGGGGGGAREEEDNWEEEEDVDEEVERGEAGREDGGESDGLLRFRGGEGECTTRDVEVGEERSSHGRRVQGVVTNSDFVPYPDRMNVVVRRSGRER